ncbi:MAG: hypothetical protein BucCj_2280 [Buchnera aphidicola (Ceratovacuna japonica)]
MLDIKLGTIEKFADPIPNNIPAIGSTDIGNIKDFPVFCKLEKIFLNIFNLYFLYFIKLLYFFYVLYY